MLPILVLSAWLIVSRLPKSQLATGGDWLALGFIFAASAVFAGLQSATPIQAESSGTATEIIFTQQKEEEARRQLRRLLYEYDLDPWIFTQEIRIEAGVDPRSHPILTLNTDYLDNDEMQLSVFLHEQAHWFVSRSVPYRLLEDEEEVAVIQKLRQMYPNALAPDYSAYLHLIVAWVELDAMVELIGEEKSREVLREKVRRLVEEPLSDVDKRYEWYNMRVLEDAEEIGVVLAKHDLIITPERGLAVQANDE